MGYNRRGLNRDDKNQNEKKKTPFGTQNLYRIKNTRRARRCREGPHVSSLGLERSRARGSCVWTAGRKEGRKKGREDGGGDWRRGLVEDCNQGGSPAFRVPSQCVGGKRSGDTGGDNGEGRVNWRGILGNGAPKWNC